MDDIEMYSLMRELIGDPPVEQVSQRKLQPYMASALNWLAAELKYLIREENLITLVAGQVNYPLPSDLLFVLWLSYNNNKIDGSSVWVWDRDGFGWRAPTAPGTPSTFAVQGRELFLNPSPSAAIVAANPVMRLRYIATPTRIERGGPVGLSELDSRIACYQAAALWCMAHPQDPANGQRKQDYEAWVLGELPKAKQRAHNPIEDFYPGFRPKVGRLGAAR
jgi:hypothetical protein